MSEVELIVFFALAIVYCVFITCLFLIRTSQCAYQARRGDMFKKYMFVAVTALEHIRILSRMEGDYYIADHADTALKEIHSWKSEP